MLVQAIHSQLSKVDVQRKVGDPSRLMVGVVWRLGGVGPCCIRGAGHWRRPPLLQRRTWGQRLLQSGAVTATPGRVGHVAPLALHRGARPHSVDGGGVYASSRARVMAGAINRGCAAPQATHTGHAALLVFRLSTGRGAASAVRLRTDTVSIPPSLSSLSPAARADAARSPTNAAYAARRLPHTIRSKTPTARRGPHRGGSNQARRASGGPSTDDARASAGGGGGSDTQHHTHAQLPRKQDAGGSV